MADEPEYDLFEWTFGDLVHHCEWVGSKGIWSESLASARASATKNMTRYVYGDAWPSQPIKDLDLDDLFLKFGNKAGTDLTPNSKKTYESRVKSAYDSYLLYKTDEQAWNREQRTTSKPNGVSSSKSKRSAKPGGGTADSGDATPSISGQVPEGLVEYPFPVRPGVFAKLWLPADLRSHEVKRLAGYLESIAMDPLPELGPGSPEAP
jgi:hypothetical protein